MENLELETLNLSEKAPFEFSPYRRRRALKSQTLSTFLRIVSECQFHFQNQEQVATVQGDQLVENNDLVIEADRLVENNDFRPGDGLARGKSLVNEIRKGDQLVENGDLIPEEGLTREKILVNEDRGGDLLVENNDSRLADGLIREKSLVDEDREGDQLVKNIDSRHEDGLAHANSLIDGNREFVSSQEPGFVGDRMDVDGLDNVKSNGDQGHVDNINGIESLIQGNQNCNNDFAEFASLLDNDDQFSLPDFDMEEFGLGEQLGNKAPCGDVSELIDSLLDADVTVGCSIPIVTKDENSSLVKRNERETQMNFRESDTPISALVAVSSSLQKTVEGIEDGEISEGSGVPQKSSDLLHEDGLPLEKIGVDKGKLSGGTIHKEGFNPNALQRRLEKDNQYFGLAKDGVNITSSALNVEMGNENRHLVENRIQVYYGDTVEDDRELRKDSRLEFRRNRQRCAPKEAKSQASCPKNISLSGGSTGENTIENQCSASTEKGADQNNRKRKQVPAEDRKAKRKKKERMARAKKKQRTRC